MVSPGLVWAVGARRAAIEEATGPFDSNPMITAARIVCSLTKPCVNKSASKSVACTAHLLLFIIFTHFLIPMEFIAARFPFLELLAIFWSVLGSKN